MKIKFLCISDIHQGDAEELKLILEKAFTDEDKFEKRPMTDAERAKKYRDSKKDRHENVTDRDEIVTDIDESISLSINNLNNNNTSEELNIPYQEELIVSEVKEEEREIDKERKKKNRKRDKPEFKRKYGQFGNVLLTDEEFEKIQKKFPDTWREQIEELSMGIASKGYTYKSHYAALLKWAQNNGIVEGRHPRARVSNLPRKSWSELADEMTGETSEVVDL